MAEIQVTVDTRRLQALIADAGPLLASVVAIAAHNIEARAKELVPVDTGATKNSIHPEFENAGLTARIGPTTEYAPFLELGTRRMAARPFLTPALEEERGRFIAAIGEVIRRHG